VPGTRVRSGATAVTPAERAEAVSRAVAALELVQLAENRGYELDQAGTSGVYVVTARSGSALHVIAGPPDEVLERVRQLA
jgi:hypothetical protein